MTQCPSVSANSLFDGPDPSALEEEILVLLEAAGISSEINDKIMKLVEEGEALLVRSETEFEQEGEEPSMGISELIFNAEAAHKVSMVALRDLEEELTNALRHQLKVGEEIDLATRKGPQFLRNVRTSHGNDRGTKRFRIETAPIVSANTKGVDLSTWSCDATPISEKNGKSMSGRVHGANNNSTVRLTGDLMWVPPSVSGEKYYEYVIQYMNEFANVSDKTSRTDREI